MTKQFNLFLAIVFVTTPVWAQIIKKESTDTSAYRANDRLQNAGPKNGWYVVDGAKYASGLLFSVHGGIASATVKNLAANRKLKSGLLAGAGIELMLLDAAFGRVPIAVHYQIAGFSIEGTDPGSGTASSNTIQLQYLKIPVQYQFYVLKEKRLFIGGGVYASFLISKKQTIRMFNMEEINNADAGIMLSAGYRLNPQLMLQANAQWGLTALEKSTAATHLDKNRFYFFSLLFSPFSAAKGKPVYGPIIKIKPKG
ncbi:MAG: PorT family protein [Lacibacter sp.]|nr:PorT family protein [Lacibacter sp.]